MRGATVMGAVCITLAACGGNPGVTGSEGEWLEGRALSVRVTGTSMGASMEVRNDSDQDAAFAPLKITVDDQVVADLDTQDAGQSLLEPGDSFTFPIPMMGEEVRIELGSGGDREVFTVARGS